MIETKKNKWLNILWSFLSVAVVATIANLFTNRNSDWYSNLAKPAEWIPAFVFPIVWTIVYILFAFAIYYLLAQNKLTKKLIVLLAVNALANILWCLLFFTLQSLIGGLIIIVINLIVAVLLIKELIDKDIIFGYYLIIYPIWLSIATCLNIAVWILN